MADIRRKEIAGMASATPSMSQKYSEQLRAHDATYIASTMSARRKSGGCLSTSHVSIMYHLTANHGLLSECSNQVAKPAYRQSPQAIRTSHLSHLDGNCSTSAQNLRITVATPPNIYIYKIHINSALHRPSTPQHGGAAKIGSPYLLEVPVIRVIIVSSYQGPQFMETQKPFLTHHCTPGLQEICKP